MNGLKTLNKDPGIYKGDPYLKFLNGEKGMDRLKSSNRIVVYIREILVGLLRENNRAVFSGCKT